MMDENLELKIQEVGDKPENVNAENIGPNSNKRQEILINLELRKKKSIVEVRNKRKQIRRTKSSLSINKNKKLGTTENTLNHPNNEGENENCERKTEFVGADESEEDKKEELQNKEHQSSNKSERGSAFRVGFWPDIHRV